MRLVEKHRVRPTDPRFAAIDAAAFASKNLYNKALYATRQAFFQDGSFPSSPTLYQAMKAEPEYRALPRKVAQWGLKQVCAAWDSYRRALAASAAAPDAFLGRPRLPRYLDKHGRNLLVYTTQALSRPGLRAGRIEPSGLGIAVPTKQTDIAQARIVPRGLLRGRGRLRAAGGGTFRRPRALRQRGRGGGRARGESLKPAGLRAAAG